MAPEQLTEGRVDARTDVYAVGLLLYEMLAGGTTGLAHGKQAWALRSRTRKSAYRKRLKRP